MSNKYSGKQDSARLQKSCGGLHLNRATVSKAFSNETLRAQLATRGIDPTQLTTVGKLIKIKNSFAKQILCANMMLNLHDKRSEREKLAYNQSFFPAVP